MATFEQAQRISTAVESKAETFFKEQLESLGLTNELIDRADANRLEQLLERVNEAIRNPDSFGVLKTKVSLGLIGIGVDRDVSVGILPVLLQRKQRILDRLREVRPVEEIRELRAVVRDVSDESARTKLESELSRLSERFERYSSEERDVREALAKQSIEHEKQIAQMEIERYERKSRVWLQFIARESIANLIGAILLLIIVFIHIGALIWNATPPEVLNNGFLVILGYFFGQSVAKGESRTNASLPGSADL